MRKSAYIQESVDTIMLALAPQIQEITSTNESLLVLGACVDLKGISAFNIVLDILDEQGITYTAKPFYIISSNDTIDLSPNVELLEAFFDMSITKTPLIDTISGYKELITNKNYNAPTNELKYYKRIKTIMNYSEEIEAHDKTLIVTGHKFLSPFKKSGIIDNTARFTKDNTLVVTLHEDSYAKLPAIYQINPNQTLSFANSPFNQEALDFITNANIDLTTSQTPNPIIDISNYTNSELEAMVLEWTTKHPARVLALKVCEKQYNISISKSNISFTELCAMFGK